MLNVGDHIRLIHNATENDCIIERIICGSIYEVSINCKKYAFKWFDSKDYLHFNRSFYENLKYKSYIENPSKCLLWPINITDYTDEGFGYVMEIIPEEYISMSSWLLGINNVSTQTLIRVALNLVYSIRSLGIQGLSGLDLHDGNVFFDPITGNVIIADTDEISSENHSNYEYGIKRYQSPETVLDYSLRNIYSDRHSLAVILFMLFYKVHPLEGKKTKGIVFNRLIENEIYGINPIFVFDPTDNTNTLYDSSRFALVMWELTPQYIKKLFEHAFSQIALKKPNRRPIELEWIKNLARWDAEIEKCDNCGYYFTGDIETINVCPFCGQKNTVQYYLEVEGNTYTIQDGNVVRKCLANITDNTLLLPVTSFIAKKDNKHILGIKNCSRNSWQYNKIKKIEPGKIVPIFDGMTVNTSYCNLTIHKKKANNNNGDSQHHFDSFTEEMCASKVEQKEMIVVFVLDTSKSMKGEPINRAYHYIENILSYLQEYSRCQSDIKVKFSILEYNTKTDWITGDKPLSFDDEFDIEYRNGGGISDIGAALYELNVKLNKNHFMSEINVGRVSPVILFFADGCEPFSFYGYNWEDELKNLQNNRWFRIATKCAISTSEVSDNSVLEKIVGSEEAIINDEFSLGLMKSILRGNDIVS